MVYYSSNGNISHIDLERESSPDYILEAVKSGYKVRFCIRLMSDDNLWIGEHEAKYKIEDIDFLFKNSKHFLIHCKNISSLHKLREIDLKKQLHYYYHATDNVSISSKGYFLIDYGKRPLGENVIAMFPEDTDYQISDLKKCFGVCSGNIEFYKKLIENETSGSNTKSISA
jgi:hypothetical protein